MVDGFLPVVAPASVVPIREDEHYATEEEFVFAVADARTSSTARSSSRG
ncbi:MAG: hypothetical protein R2736_22940 [Solirubrobacterales bacterium]